MAPRSRTECRSDAVLCFDLGGTWWRAGLLHRDDRIHLLSRTPALSVRTRPEPPSVLQDLLVDHVVEVARSANRVHRISGLAVSLGAAVNGRTGLVVAGAPLWGPGRHPMDLAGRLRTRLPGTPVAVLNDVSALAHAARAELPPGTPHRRIAVVTVSSGIAYRTIDTADGRIPLDGHHGLQGEIGHLPSSVRWRGQLLAARCDCGATGHVSAYAAGPGIARLLAELPAAAHLGRGRESAATELARTAREGDPRSLELLDLFTEPLARVLLHQATLDPEVSDTRLYGGVADAFGDTYVESLLRHLDALGLYGITDHDPGYFAERVRHGRGTGLEPLRGAGLYLRHSHPLQEDTP